MRRLAEFVAATFAYSWGLMAAYVYAGGGLRDPFSPLVVLAYMFGPLVGAVFVSARRGEDVASGLGARLRPNRWIVVAWLLPASVAVLAVALALLHPDASLAVDGAAAAEPYGGALAPGGTPASGSLTGVPLWFVVVSVLLTGLLAGATVNAVAAFGEEAGWRGLMLHEMRDEGFWTASVVTGVVWGLWHVPLVAQGYNYPSDPALGVFAMVAFTVSASPLLTYLRLRSGSVVAPSVFHGTVNATAGLSSIAIVGVSGFVVGAGAATTAAFVVASVAVVVYDRFGGDRLTSSRVGDYLDV